MDGGARRGKHDAGVAGMLACDVMTAAASELASLNLGILLIDKLRSFKPPRCFSASRGLNAVFGLRIEALPL